MKLPPAVPRYVGSKAKCELVVAVFKSVKEFEDLRLISSSTLCV